MSPDTLVAPTDANAIRTWMVNYIENVIDIQQDPFPLADRFDAYGLDSVEITIMCGMLEQAYSIEVEPGEIYDNPSVEDLSKHLARRLAGTPTTA